MNYLGTISYPIKVAANFNEYARQHKDMGMDVGSTDLRISWRLRGIYHVLYLELKTKKGKLSPEQILWNEDFDENFASENCKRAVAYGYEHAVTIINAAILPAILSAQRPHNDS